MAKATKKKSGKNKVGAKSKYNPEWVSLVEAYARRGMTDKQMCECLRISHDTFYNYIKKHPEFSEAIKRGREPVHMEVENALLKNALGYEYDEEQYEVFADGKIDKKRKRVVKKHVPGNLGAQIFWLINRLPDFWKQRKDDGKNGNVEEIKETLADFVKSL